MPDKALAEVSNVREKSVDGARMKIFHSTRFWVSLTAYFVLYVLSGTLVTTSANCMMNWLTCLLGDDWLGLFVWAMEWSAIFSIGTWYIGERVSIFKNTSMRVLLYIVSLPGFILMGAYVGAYMVQ